MSISMEYYCSRLEIFLSLLIKWLLLPVRWLAIWTDRESPHGNQSDIMRKAVRDSLHVATYGELIMKTTVEETTCAVCLSEVQGRDRVWELRNCSHVFHKGCLDTWLDHDEHLTCPLCRAPLMTPAQAHQGPFVAREEPSWAVERLLYLFGDDLLLS